MVAMMCNRRQLQAIAGDVCHAKSQSIARMLIQRQNNLVGVVMGNPANAFLSHLLTRLPDALQGSRQVSVTFDATPHGNIGPVTDALLGALNATFAVACPALPENGSTVFQGHLFVGDALLSEPGLGVLVH